MSGGRQEGRAMEAVVYQVRGGPAGPKAALAP